MTVSESKRNETVENNLGLVHSCANRFKGRGVEYDDLFQAGCVGLIKAADNFDETKGFSFSTYAVPVILGEIKRIFRDGGPVKIGRTVKEKSRMAVKIRDMLSSELGRDPTIFELADKIKIEPEEAAMLLNAAMPVVSLTAGEEGESQIDIPVDSPENEINDFLALRQVLQSLDEHDRKMIELRYYSGMTQSKTALKLGMTQVQVSRREKVVLEIIRKKLNT
ncbi:MAG: sigma-70 family RNA polymerase sigma factor [Clostridia bacterium]|nr:sigma-70 family RNA polymerase sigma factor [Clostridia bacterium]